LDDEDLERAQRAVTRLQDEILDRARANERGSVTEVQ
jgi:hypothetical protein